MVDLQRVFFDHHEICFTHIRLQQYRKSATNLDQIFGLMPTKQWAFFAITHTGLQWSTFLALTV